MLLKLFKRPLMGKLVFLLLCAGYIALLLNIAYYRQVAQILPLDSLHNIVFFLSMPLVAFCVINILLTLASFLWLDRLLGALFILLSARAQFFIMTYGIIVDRSMVTNILDTTAAESFALMTPKLLLVLLVSAIIPILLMFCGS